MELIFSQGRQDLDSIINTNLKIQMIIFLQRLWYWMKIKKK